MFGDSCTGTRRVTSYASNTCNSPTYPGPEILYTFTGEASLADLELTPLGLADLGLFLVRNCASPTTCVDFHDAIGPGAVSTVPRLSSGYLSGIYYVYVDSYYADGPMSCGSYRLSVRGELKIAERVSFSVD